MSLKYTKDPRVTNDRTPPKWFMDRLKEIDPQLRVEWWNCDHRQAPAFRLLRIGTCGRYAEIKWFQREDEMRLLVDWLIANDTHRSNVEERTARAMALEQQMERVRQEHRDDLDSYEKIAVETVEAAKYEKDRIYSIPGVNTRRNWNG